MPPAIHQTVDHLFRHESGKLVSAIAKLLGLQHLETAQDIVQDTLLQALSTWSYNGLPDNPPAWLHRVAKNKAIDFLRRHNSFQNKISPQYAYLLQSEYVLSQTVNNIFNEGGIEDSQLRMIFACCHPVIPIESQLALALKTLCGLSVGEIAKAFLTAEDTIAKRIYRAKEKIKSEGIELELPPASQLQKRLDAVLHCVYLLFNEGYNSSQPDQLIREDLCEEAMRLAFLLTKNGSTNLPRTNALLALFCFQASRLPARIDKGGNIILLKYQDRNLWFKPLIQKGFYYLDLATGEETSTYHVEAAIAYFHAKSPTFKETDWEAIYYLYTLLYQEEATPFIALNKGIAAMYAKDADTALAELQQIKGLEKYYLYHTAIGEVYFENGQQNTAIQHYQKALTLTSSLAEQALIQMKIRDCKAS